MFCILLHSLRITKSHVLCDEHEKEYPTRNAGVPQTDDILLHNT